MKFPQNSDKLKTVVLCPSRSDDPDSVSFTKATYY